MATEMSKTRQLDSKRLQREGEMFERRRHEKTFPFAK
jgi:hypothetical protein